MLDEAKFNNRYRNYYTGFVGKETLPFNDGEEIVLKGLIAFALSITMKMDI